MDFDGEFVELVMIVSVVLYEYVVADVAVEAALPEVAVVMLSWLQYRA